MVLSSGCLLPLEATWCAHKTQQRMGCSPGWGSAAAGCVGLLIKCVPVMAVMLSAGKCPCLEMLRRGQCSLWRYLTAVTLMEMPPDSLA